ncbi:hypothetical protein [Haloechinothrix halophila]|uniref:hypothetical protein n=1 Tax=Haloechinothrix halophila TaxID=1069073 RepID=UPI00042325FA|nr:hypothetical protein [Haloechinothrix halophila]
MSDTGWHQPDQPNDRNQQQPPMPPPPSWQAPQKPGVIALRPLSLTEIIDAAVKTMRSYPGVMLGVAAIVATITAIIELPFQASIGDPTSDLGPNPTPTDVAETLEPLALGTGVGGILGLVAGAFLTGVLTTVVGKAVLGRQAPFSTVWAEVKPQLGRLIGLALFSIVPALGLVLVVVAVGLVLPPLLLLVIPAAIVVGFWLYVLYFGLAAPALVLERCGVIESVKRSRVLVQRSWWRIFGILLLTGILVVVISGIIQIPFGIIGGGASAFAGDPGGITFFGLVIAAIGAIIAATITQPFFAAVVALLYTDQRMRREGLDIELARNAGNPPPQ